MPPLQQDVDVVIPVLGAGAATYSRTRKAVERWIVDTLQTLGHETSSLLAVCSGALWRSAYDDLRPDVQVIEFPNDGRPEDRLRRVRAEIVRAIVRARADRLKILVSFDPEDVLSRAVAHGLTSEVARINHAARLEESGWVVMPSSESRRLSDQMDTDPAHTVVVAIRGDRHSLHVSERELLQAKLQQLPIILVDASANIDARDADPTYVDPYGGNLHRVRWNGRVDATLEAALVEWLSAHHFRSEAERLKHMVRGGRHRGGLPIEDAEVAIRRPELLNVAHWWRRRRGIQVLMHPDPELPEHDREFLQNAYPRLRFVTPSTVYRGGADAGSTFPLAGVEVAVSVSDVEDFDPKTGTTSQHLEDAYHATARRLLAAGAVLSYAGDFRADGHMQQLIEVVNAFSGLAGAPSERLNAYMSVDVEPPRRFPVRIRSMIDDAELKSFRALAYDAKWPRWLYLSDLRSAMAAATDARIVVGGNHLPKGSDRRPGHGYMGPLPGIVEEALRSLEANKPLFLLGGFGGAAKLVVDAVEGRRPAELQLKTFEDNERFLVLARELYECAEAKNEPFNRLALPSSLDATMARLAELGRAYFHRDDDAPGGNGLTLAENRTLWSTRDPAVVSALVMRGLLVLPSSVDTSTWHVELVQGDWTSAYRLDACVILADAADQVPFGGPQGGEFSWASASEALPGIDAASVAMLVLDEAHNARFADALDELGRWTDRHDLKRVGIIMPAGPLDVAYALIPEQIKRTLPAGATLVIVDPQEERLHRLAQAFAQTDRLVARRTRKRLSIV